VVSHLCLFFSMFIKYYLYVTTKQVKMARAVQIELLLLDYCVEYLQVFEYSTDTRSSC